MTSVVITVAGISSRFNQNLNRKYLKAIYFENDYRETLLYQMLNKVKDRGQIVIIGGYLFEELKEYVIEYLDDALKSKIVLVYNEHYADLASGYSLYIGLQEVFKNQGVQEVIFIEGDLHVDKSSLDKVIQSPKNVFTYSKEVIQADRAVVVYEDIEEKYHFIYNLNHGCLSITVPFRSIYNSGQCWKFNDIELLKRASKAFFSINQNDTNLLLIQTYFDSLQKAQIERIGFEQWINCNTIKDYHKAKKHWEVS